MNLLSFVLIQVLGGALVSMAGALLALFLLAGMIGDLVPSLVGLWSELVKGVYRPHVAGGGSLGELLTIGLARQAGEILFLTLVLSFASLIWMASATELRGRRLRKLVGVIFWIPGPAILWFVLASPSQPLWLLMLSLAWTALGGGLLSETATALVLQGSQERTGPAFQLVRSLGRPKGALFPFPGTDSGWMLAATAYRVLPELASRMPILVGFGLAFDIIQNQPGLASLALQALVGRDAILLAGAILSIQLLVRLAVLPVQALLFAIYPRRRWSIT